ncbi:hypothetical protein FB45DRAFT_351321 [Roridomyces roridus]|uniref:Uncharacterized protein n=1 Tax=Roridomyces roridus TaxID=1738132 RepID=A0AAD7FV27_9AGAR|nr:hypothetical protein FB45DRAFT_351321 [Roridomyces roridus]
MRRSIFQLGPTIHLCLSFSTPSFCAWEDVENALLSGSGTHLQRLMAEVDLFSKELRRVYDRDARHKRRQTLCNLQFWALVIFSILFLIWTMWTSGHIPRGWTAAILFPSLLLFFFELFLLTCAPSRTVVGDVDTKVSRLLGQLGGLNERYTLLKELVDAGDTKAIAVLLEHEGHRKLSQLSIKHRPDVNGA